MEENENRKGPGVFYAVVGVATLVVAIIGATFAYFSASTSSSGDDITGSTRNLTATSLSLTVDKIEFNAATATSNDLVPAFFGVTGEAPSTTLNVAAPANLTSTQVSSMLTNHCEQGGYTGCHLYKITADTDEDIPVAYLRLDLNITTSTTKDKDQWGYVVFTGSDTANATNSAKTDSVTLTAINSNNGAPAAIGNGVSALDINNGGNLTTAGRVYYLLVYVNDTDVPQNATTTENEQTVGNNDYVIGSYAGTVTLDAVSGGKVRATFGA